MKVAVTPCTGIGQLFGAITREAGYKIVDELCPEETVLVCLPALAAEVQEDIDFINDYPVLVLNGCKDRCASRVVEQKGGRITSEVFLPQVISKDKISLTGDKRNRLSDKSYQAVNAMSEVAAKIIKDIVTGTEA